MQKIWNGPVSALYCGTVCDTSSIPRTCYGRSESYSVPYDVLEGYCKEHSMDQDRLARLEDSITRNRDALRLLSE